jgi:hypothetical protein
VLTLDIPSRRVLANGGGALGKFDLLPLTRFFSRQWKAEKKIAEDARDFLFVPKKNPFFPGARIFRLSLGFTANRGANSIYLTNGWPAR